MVLNIAEGNGRYLQGDLGKFLDIAGASAAKAAAYLDLCCRSGELEQSQRDRGTELLCRVALMLRALTLCPLLASTKCATKSSLIMSKLQDRSKPAKARTSNQA